MDRCLDQWLEHESQQHIPALEGVGNDVDAEVLARHTAVEVAVEQEKAYRADKYKANGRHNDESDHLDAIRETEEHL